MKAQAQIRSATKPDLDAIEVWLKAEREQTGEGFYCNWSIILDTFKQGYLSVLSDGEDVVGFLADSPTGPNIVEVRPDVRGRGYGAQLAQWAINSAFARGNSVLEGECAPESSSPFWQRMGLTIVPGRSGYGGGVYAYKILPRQFELSSGPRTAFSIGFFPKERDWDKKVAPFRTYAGEAELLPDGILRLPERAICFDPTIHDFADCVVQMAVSGGILFEDKVKRDEARAYGVGRDAGYIYYVDQIRLP